MVKLGLQDVQNSKHPQTELLCCQLRAAHEHIEDIIRMVQAGQCDLVVLSNLEVLQVSLDNITAQLIADYLDKHLAANILISSPAKQEQILSNIVNLYGVICRLDWAHKETHAT